MEEAESTDLENDLGSDDVTGDHHCEQCQESGQFVLPAGYCLHCNDFLCRDCIAQHRKLRASKEHVILDETSMPKQKIRSTNWTECKDHPGRQLELFCCDDNRFGCVICFTVGHRTCENISPISKLSKDVDKSKEMNEFKKSSEEHNKVVDYCKKLIDEFRLLNDHWRYQSMADFETFRSKVEAGLQKLGKRVQAESTELRDTNLATLDSLSECVDSLGEDIKEITTDVEMKVTLRQMDQLFISLRQNANYMIEYRRKVGRLLNDIHVQRYVFEVDPMLVQMTDIMLTNNEKMKKLSGSVRCDGNILTKSTDDRKDCSIVGIVEVSPTEILVIDYENECLKRVNIQKNEVTQRRALKSPPWDITAISGSRVAITIPVVHQIHLFSASNTLEPCGHIDVGGGCVAIQSTDDALVVSFWDAAKVQVIDFEGNVLSCIITDSSGKALFDMPRYLSLSPDRSCIYVSDWKNDTLTSVGTDGTIHWVYKDINLTVPLGVTTSRDGCVYVCSCDRNVVHVVSPRGVRLRTISLAGLSVTSPKVLTYSSRREWIYASSESTGNFVWRLRLE